MSRLRRILRHLAAPHWVVRQAFPKHVGDVVAAAVRAAEKAHDAELRIVVEGGMPPLAVLRGKTSRARALELFSLLRVWDTERNTGVLVYLQFADRKIEIVADRGIASKVKQHEWDAACTAMARDFRAGRFEAGVLAGIERVAALLAQHVPPRPAGEHAELPNRPTVL